MQVQNVSQPGFGLVAGAATDANGRAVVRVRFGSRTGPGRIAVSVPLYNLTDTAAYTILAGAPVRVQLTPRDTAIVVGASFRYRGSTVDRLGNPRQDPTTYEASSTVLTVDGSGNVTGRDFGAAHVRVRATIAGITAADSGRVAVVPQATIAKLNSFSGPFVLTDLTGVVQKTITQGPAFAASWAPGTNRLVFARFDRLYLTDIDGNETPLLTPNVLPASWPEFSADAQWVYFHGVESGRTGYHIFRIRPDGTALQHVGGPGSYPTTSPDGTKVAFVSASSSVVVLDLVTGTSVTLPQTLGAIAPRWSPNGDWIAYTRYDNVVLVSPDGAQRRQIATASYVEPGLSWSPDSRWVLAAGFILDVPAGVPIRLNWGGLYPAWKR